MSIIYGNGGKTLDEAKGFFSGFHAEVTAEKIYLYCTAEPPPDQKITSAQSVGYPRKVS